MGRRWPPRCPIPPRPAEPAVAHGSGGRAGAAALAVAACLALALALSACGAAQRRPAARAGAATACARVAPACDGAPADYATLVAPIVAARCLRCHSGDGDAAEDHDFSRPETLRAQQRSVHKQLLACAMPPRRAPPLPDAEAEVLLRWVACGAPLP